MIEKSKFIRLLTLLTLLMALSVLPVTANATTTAGNTSNAYLSQMGTEAFSAYKVFINIAIPFAILSIAKSGFEILYASWLGKGEFELDKTKQKVVMIFGATICLIAMPYVVGWTKSKVELNAWEPPSGLQPLTGDWSGLQNYNSNSALTSSESGAIEGYFRNPDPDGKHLEYWVYVPNNATTNMPLIIWLHGNDPGKYGNMPAIENDGMMKKVRDLYGNNYPFIGLQPCATDYGWEDKPVKELIDYIVQEYSIDSSRIIITGHSMGAYNGVWHYMGLYGDFFSAAVPVSWRAKDYSSDTSFYDNWAEIPTRAYYGSVEAINDSRISGMQSDCRIIQQRGGDAECIVLPGLEHYQTAYEPYTQDLIEWMISQ